MTELKFLSVETAESWATRAQDAGDTADELLSALMDQLFEAGTDMQRKTLQSALLQLSEARVFPKLIIGECEISRRIGRKEKA